MFRLFSRYSFFMVVLTLSILTGILMSQRSTPAALAETETNRPPEVEAAMQRFLADQQPAQDLAAMPFTPCVGGMAGSYPCNNIDLMSLVPLSTFGATAGNSLWGWTDSLTGKEYALMGLNNGLGFVDITTPETPVYLGKLPTHTGSSSWRDVRVYQNHAFVVSDNNGSHGMQVFDLTRLRTVSTPPVTFTADAHYNQVTNVHTISINEATGYAYLVGSNTCSGGLHMVNIQNPTSPTFAGCYSGDGYTHEVQCWVYNGPDTTYVGREICFANNTDTLTIVDVTNKAAPVQLSRTGYSGRGYTHQSWLSEDHTYLLLNDELDESNFGHNSRTWIWNVSDLNAPPSPQFHDGPTTAIDHNLYIVGDYAYEANYRAGLYILNISGIASGNLVEQAYFDVYPSSNSANFNGAWNNYPFFASGNVIVSGIEQGLFVLRPNLDAPPPSNTGYLNPSANTAVTSSAGDNNGFQTNPTNAYTDNSSFAVDTNSGTSTSTSCTNNNKDKHLYYNYNFSLPGGATIDGIQVRLDGRVDSTIGSPKFCIQLSWNGGTTWTAAKTTSNLTTSEVTYILGGAADTWGRTWNSSEFGNSSFRVRIIPIASSTSRDFSLDWIAVQVTYH